MKRRALLAALGVATSTATGGCLGSVADRLDETVQLGWLAAHNLDAEPHGFDLAVERNGESVHRSSHEIDGKDDDFVHGVVADCTWGDAPGGYTVRARVDGGEWVTREISEVDGTYEGDVDCAIAEVEYRNGATSVAFQGGCDRVDDYDGGCGFANRGETEDGSA